jgi:2-polyprenyl-3-methyl-5-hydroxy-6-metoxy-1,4-benzoquinol methylase
MILSYIRPMQYEPIKHSIDKFISKSVLLKKLFFRVLDIHLLRTWHIHKEIKNICSAYHKPFDVLDAGCGFGQYSWYILRKFKNSRITGIDISDSHIDKATKFFKKAGYANTEFKTADLTIYQSADSYDLVVSVDVMEHIEEDIKVFHNFYKSLHKGGYVLINTPSDQGGSDVHHEEDKSFIDEHVRDGYSPADISEKLSQAGFTNIKARYTYGTPGKISWKLSMKIPITLLNASKLFFIFLPFYLIVTYPFCLILNYIDTQLTHASGTGLLVTAQKPS